MQIKYINVKTSEYVFKGNIKAAITMNRTARIILAIGPAIAILPFISSSLLSSLVKTEPGNAITIPINDDASAINNPRGHALNSAS